MNFHDLFIKPYESYETYQIILEFTAAFFGLLSVYFSIKKNIWVYPTGIVSTALYVYILFKFGLLGDMMINFYYTVMSIYGWILWAKSSADHVHVEVSHATKKEWMVSAGLFLVSLLLVTVVYYYKPFIDNQFSTENVNFGLYHLDWANWLDIFTTAIFLVHRRPDMHPNDALQRTRYYLCSVSGFHCNGGDRLFGMEEKQGSESLKTDQYFAKL